MKFTAIAPTDSTSITLRWIALSHDTGDSFIDTATIGNPSFSITGEPISTDVAVTGVTLDQETLSLEVGGTATLNATVEPSDASDPTVTWSSDNTDVATVDQTGKVTAVTAGSANITATAGDQTATCAVTVSEPVEEPDPIEYGNYTVAMPADKTAAAGETVSIPVTVGTKDETVTTYNAVDMKFSYDTSVLELTSTAIEGYTVTDENGVVRVQGYGEDKTVGSEAFALTFKVIGVGETTVKVESAKVDIAANAISEDAPNAEPTDADTKITISGYTVTLPDGFTSEQGTVVNAGESYTFAPVDPYYDYTVTYTMGDGEATAITANDDGEYVIENITGNVVISASKQGKTFGIEVDGTGASDVSYEGTPTYGTPFAVTVTQASGYTYDVAITIDGGAYTGYEVANGVYTIPGGDIKGDIKVTVTKNEIPKSTFNVTFEGNGAGHVTEGANSVEEGSSYSFVLEEKIGYKYTISAATEDGTSVTMTELNRDTSGVNPLVTYYIDKVTANLKISINYVIDADISVTEYVKLKDGSTVYLVVATELGKGRALSYDGNAMYVASKYNDKMDGDYNAYAYLVTVAQGEEALTEEVALTKLALYFGSSAGLVNNTGDVNTSGTVDINDAQLTYDIYNGKYQDFTLVSMLKFLNADVNCDMKVDVTDAAAVVSVIE